jgi:hypothetical protein
LFILSRNKNVFWFIFVIDDGLGAGSAGNCPHKQTYRIVFLRNIIFSALHRETPASAQNPATNRTRHHTNKLNTFIKITRRSMKMFLAQMAYQLPSAVSASPHVQGPQRPVAGMIGDAPQTAHLPVQSGSVSGSGLRRGRGFWGGFFMPIFYGQKHERTIKRI